MSKQPTTAEAATTECRGTYLDNVLRGDGYHFNYDALTGFWDKATHGHELKPNTMKWFEVMALFLILAYQAGKEDLPLTAGFPFLETIQQPAPPTERG